jgi:hypothetical protein
MKYDVAISFAGEQRLEARQIAECLTRSGLKVFYDEYEDAQLWGKNLYDHLSRVYQKEADYCIILISSAYAKKVWTNHERQGAQARALQEKETEYILPVRFDETELPGMLPTISCLDFSKYGASGVCNAFLRKIKRASHETTPNTTPSFVVASSKRVLLFEQRGPTVAYIPAIKASWGVQDVSFRLVPDDPTDGPFLDGLQGVTREIIVAYAGKAAICKNLEITHESDAHNDCWSVKAQIQQSDFSSTLEVGTSSTSSEQFAEMRTRRLLLDEYPAKDTRDVNEIFREILLRGQGVAFEITGSPFPTLFAAFGQNPQKFLEIAWIHAVMTLKLSNCVVDIEQLQLQLADASLRVNFKGKRWKQYQNVPAHQIKVEGSCSLRQH